MLNTNNYLGLSNQSYVATFDKIMLFVVTWTVLKFVL